MRKAHCHHDLKCEGYTRKDESVLTVITSLPVVRNVIDLRRGMMFIPIGLLSRRERRRLDGILVHDVHSKTPWPTTSLR